MRLELNMDENSDEKIADDKKKKARIRLKKQRNYAIREKNRKLKKKTRMEDQRKETLEAEKIAENTIKKAAVAGAYKEQRKEVRREKIKKRRKEKRKIQKNRDVKVI